MPRLLLIPVAWLQAVDQSLDNVVNVDELTNTIGKHIRDTLRTDSNFLAKLGITAADAKNRIFFTTPVDQHKGFSNPRVVIVTQPSDANKLSYTEIYQGSEIFMLNIWVDSIPTYSSVLDALDRAVTIFNKLAYSFETAGVPYNFGEFICDRKQSYPEVDKKNTRKGELSISFNIGGV